jgi:hypothetical protein
MQAQRLSNLRIDELKRLCRERQLATKLFEERPSRQGLCLLIILSQRFLPRSYKNLSRADVARLLFGGETEFIVTHKDTKLFLLRSIHNAVEEHLVDATKSLAKELSLCIFAIETDLIANTLHNRVTINNLSCLHAGLIALLVTYINNRMSLEQPADAYDLVQKLQRKYLRCTNIYEVVAFFLYYPSNYRICYGLDLAISKLQRPIVLSPPATSKKRNIAPLPIVPKKSRQTMTAGHVEQFFRDNIRGTLLTNACRGMWHGHEYEVILALFNKFGGAACVLPELIVRAYSDGRKVSITHKHTQTEEERELEAMAHELLEVGAIDSLDEAGLSPPATLEAYKTAIARQQCNLRSIFFFPLALFYNDSVGHANTVIIDTKNCRIIRFDPNTVTGATIDPVGRLADSYLEKKFAPYVFGNKRYRVITPIGFCPMPGPQAYESLSTYFKIKCDRGEEGGFCMAWSMLLINLIIVYPDDDPSVLLHEMLNAHRWDLDSIHIGLEQKRDEQYSHPVVQLDALLQIIVMKYARFIELLLQGRSFRAGPRVGAVLPRFQRR